MIELSGKKAMCTAVRLDLHRDTQTVLPIRASTAKRQCGLPLPGDPSTRTRPATRPGRIERLRLCKVRVRSVSQNFEMKKKAGKPTGVKTVNKGAEWAWLSGEFVVALVVQVMSQPGMKEATN